MPFASNTERLSEIPTQLNEVCTFFIPGILGNGNEMVNLANLTKDSDAILPASLYFYYEKSMGDVEEYLKAGLTLEKHAELIAEQIKDGFPKRSRGAKQVIPPHTIVGYSFGCTLAVLVGNLLRSEGYQSNVFLIDGVAPQATQKYFQTNKAAFNLDLQAIVNYAALLSRSDSTPFSIDPELSKNLTLDEQFSFLEMQYLKFQPFGNEEEQKKGQKIFSLYLQIAKHHLTCAIGYQPPPLPHIAADQNSAATRIILTQSTKNKYGTTDGGWGAFSKIELIENPGISALDHLALLTEENCDLMANELVQFLDTHLSQACLAQHTQEVLNSLLPKNSVAIPAQPSYSTGSLSSSPLSTGSEGSFNNSSNSSSSDTPNTAFYDNSPLSSDTEGEPLNKERFYSKQTNVPLFSKSRLSLTGGQVTQNDTALESSEKPGHRRVRSFG